jgi:competence protein ComEA
MEKYIDKTKDLIGDIIRDRKTLVKILSVLLILLAALCLKIHDSSKADIKIESSGQTSGPEQTEAEEEEYSPQVIYVDIGGAVISPGVYQVAADTRLYQVIEMAGGLAEDADTDSVNQASFVEDGQKIIIPVKGAANADAPSSDTSSSSGITADGLVNINTADAEELKTLNGIGDVTAQKIIEYRSSKAFVNKEDIMSVNGIGNGIYQKIKDRITC